MNKKGIKLYKSGKFYNAFGDDGIILHELMGYKYIEHKKLVGYPEVAHNKVLNILESEKVPYVVYDKDDVKNEYKGIVKNYNNILKKALQNLEMEKRLERLKKRINNFSLEELEKLVEDIENAR